MPSEVWVALVPIWHGQTRAYAANDIVPDSNEAKWDYSGQGLVARVTRGDDVPDSDELGVAFRRDVVLREQLHVSPTAPEAPAVGTVWIDTSL